MPKKTTVVAKPEPRLIDALVSGKGHQRINPDRIVWDPQCFRSDERHRGELVSMELAAIKRGKDSSFILQVIERYNGSYVVTGFVSRQVVGL
jgi:hypothetical protein